MMIFAELLTLAKKTSVHLQDATATWDTTATHTLTVPTGKRWYFLSTIVWRTQAATLLITHTDSAGSVLAELLYATAAASGLSWPGGIGAIRSLQGFYPLIADAGEEIRYVLSVAQDASAYIAYNYLEVDL